jgi:hypothetical protein
MQLRHTWYGGIAPLILNSANLPLRKELLVTSNYEFSWFHRLSRVCGKEGNVLPYLKSKAYFSVVHSFVYSLYRLGHLGAVSKQRAYQNVWPVQRMLCVITLAHMEGAQNIRLCVLEL